MFLCKYLRRIKILTDATNAKRMRKNRVQEKTWNTKEVSKVLFYTQQISNKTKRAAIREEEITLQFFVLVLLNLTARNITHFT